MPGGESPEAEALRRYLEASAVAVRAAAHALDRRDHGTPAEQEAACASARRAVLLALAVAEVLRDYLGGPHPEWPEDWGPSAN